MSAIVRYTPPRPRRSARARRLPTSRAVAVVAAPRRKRLQQRVARRRAQPNRVRSDPRSGLVADYINTLNNPFTYPSVKLGWGTMVPTALFSGYLRSSFTTNADGSFAIAMLPSIGYIQGNILINTSGHAGTTWGVAQMSNAATINDAVAEARVVSGGIKIIPQVAATAVPGIVIAGLIPATSYSQVTAVTVDTLGAFPNSTFGYGSNGACAIIRPTDVASFEFDAHTVTGWTTTVRTNTSAVYIAGQGFPASTTVFYEAVLNIEGITDLSDVPNDLTQNTGDGVSFAPTLSSVFPSIESMWQSIKPVLAPAIHVAEGAATISEMVSNTTSQAAQLARNVASRSGAGRSVSRDAYYGNLNPL